ncbi:hypothetical protein ACFOHN_03035 [Novosphingobium panipatense]|uniref:hypothetical protein n=1 Tax=Novosphingobium panipatense TaxID=428991 RepID=UPI00361FCEDC
MAASALDTFGKAEPPINGFEETNGARCQASECALGIVEGDDCRPYRIEKRAVNGHQTMIHGHCRDQSRQVLRVPLRAERCARVKSEGTRGSANAAGLKIRLCGGITDLLRVTPDTFGKGVVRGLAGTVARMGFDLP